MFPDLFPVNSVVQRCKCALKGPQRHIPARFTFPVKLKQSQNSDVLKKLQLQLQCLQYQSKKLPVQLIQLPLTNGKWDLSHCSLLGSPCQWELVTSKMDVQHVQLDLQLFNFIKNWKAS